MKYNKKVMKDIDFQGLTVVARLDYNVPMKDGKVNDTTRISATIPTLSYLLDKDCKVVILSHLGRVKTLEDKTNGKKSLAPVTEELTKLIGTKANSVKFIGENEGPKVAAAIKAMAPKDIIVLENTRYQDVDSKGKEIKRESKNEAKLGAYWASLGDVFVNDAFGTAHRAHASNVGIAKNAKISCIGLLIEKELTQLAKACDGTTGKTIAILGGAKVSDKLKVINALLTKVDKILIGGGMAYTFSKARGYDIGKSLCEEDMVEEAKRLLKEKGDQLVIASDAMCNKEFKDDLGILKAEADGFGDYMGMDIGKETIKTFKKEILGQKGFFKTTIEGPKTILWNGPMGVFEMKNYQEGTKKICEFISQATKNGAFSLIGGGDSASAAKKLGYENGFSFISTGGGASLTYMEDEVLPGIDAISDYDTVIKAVKK